MPIQQFFGYIMGIRPSKKMFWFSDYGFQKKGKEGRVFIFCFYFQRVKNITQTSSILLFWQTNNTIVSTRRDLDFPTDTSYIRSKLTKRLLFSPTSFMSVKSPTNILLHNSVAHCSVNRQESPRNYLFGT
jgi:hypothetical protein